VLACFYLGQQRRQQGTGGAWRWFLLAYLGAVVAVLLKGPIGLLLPAAVAGVYLCVEGELPSPRQGRCWLRLARQLGLAWGLPLVAVLVLPWYLWAEVQTKGKF